MICGIGLVVYLFFREYDGSLIPFPLLFWLLGIAMIAGGAFLIRYSYRNAEDEADVKRKSAMRKFTHTSEVADISFAECEILRNDYVHEVDRNTHRARAWDALVDETRNTERQKVSQNVLVVHHIINGQKHRFYSHTLNMDHDTLLFKLDMKKQTKLYFNKNNPDEYYLDLEFLDECSKSD